MIWRLAVLAVFLCASCGGGAGEKAQGEECFSSAQCGPGLICDPGASVCTTMLGSIDAAPGPVPDTPDAGPVPDLPDAAPGAPDAAPPPDAPPAIPDAAPIPDAPEPPDAAPPPPDAAPPSDALAPLTALNPDALASMAAQP